MKRRNSIVLFERERSCLSHDLLHNEFFVRIGPCWHDGRLGMDDAVYHALLGGHSSREQVEEAMKIWREVCSPSFVRLSGNVENTFGFVATEIWKEERKTWQAAGLFLDRFSVPALPLNESEAVAEANRFWGACDVVRHAITAWSGRFSEFFSDWDPALIAKGGSDE